MIVLDTNVISEIMRETPDERVMAWLGRQKTLHLAVTTLTLAEIQRGLKRLPAGARRRKLAANFAEFIARGFEGRILSFDEQAAATYGEVCALRESRGLHADPLDLMIAAVAKDADASLATRNTGDFSQCGIRLINPWELKRGG